MAIGDVKNRLKQAFDRMNEHIDSAEDSALARQWSGPQVLRSELATTRSMLDVVATRLSALPPGEREGFETELDRLRDRLDDAQDAFDTGKKIGRELRPEEEKLSRETLDEVQNGLLQLVSEMNARYGGHPPAPPAP
jgi:hypothetical protein